jgi:hypothetical protein
MLKVCSSQLSKIAQDWMDEIRDVDWGDDEPDAPGIVNEENLDDYLVDEIEDDTEQPPPTPPGRHPVPTEVDEIREEIPTANELLGIPEGTKEIPYRSPQQLLYDAMDAAEVVSFEYTNRHGNYAGLRTVEPHYAFVAQTTGNEVVVTLDRDVNDIRAFIIGNIHPGGVRYEGINFSPRAEIMRGVA